MMLYGLASWMWGADQRDLPFPVSDFDIVNLGPAVLSYLNIATLLITLVLMLILFLFFRYTKVGIAMKATQQNAMAARINGIRTNRILSITWALSSMIGAVAGILLAPIATLDPNLMLDPLLKGFASAVLGGMTSLVGAALGGYMLGIIENLFGGYVSLEFKSIVAFGIIVLVLCFKPSGLFSRHYVRKV
jgi:branched-chain amino acid transport system permease protein